MSKFSSSDIILIGGDFNSRLGTQDDIITENENDLAYLPQDYEIDGITSIRNNQNISINYYGRTEEDLQGHITYIENNEHSTVDLV